MLAAARTWHKRRRTSYPFAAVALLTATAFAQPPHAAQEIDRAAVLELLEDDVEPRLRQFHNDGGADATKIRRDLRDFYSGVCSIHVTPFQRYSSRLPGWNYPIVEKPGAGQYRFLRFAWKRGGGAGIMIQLHASNGSWNQRYFAGNVSPNTRGWGAMLQVSATPPGDWQVVTRDLYKDHGSFTITGLALTPMEEGSGGWFDHFYLGRSVEDLDKASAAMFAKTPLKEALAQQRLGQLWDELASRDVATAGAALRTLVAGRKDSIAFLKERWLARTASPNAAAIARLIADLDDSGFPVREKAHRALEKLGLAAVPALQTAAQRSSSAEVRKRATQILDKYRSDEDMLSPDQLRLVRLIRILEWSATPEARQLLAEMAKANLEAGLGHDADLALKRITK